jgi:hypothetical protein
MLHIAAAEELQQALSNADSLHNAKIADRIANARVERIALIADVKARYTAQRLALKVSGGDEEQLAECDAVQEEELYQYLEHACNEALAEQDYESSQSLTAYNQQCERALRAAARYTQRKAEPSFAYLPKHLMNEIRAATISKLCSLIQRYNSNSSIVEQCLQTLYTALTLQAESTSAALLAVDNSLVLLVSCAKGDGAAVLTEAVLRIIAKVCETAGVGAAAVCVTAGVLDVLAAVLTANAPCDEVLLVGYRCLTALCTTTISSNSSSSSSSGSSNNAAVCDAVFTAELHAAVAAVVAKRPNNWQIQCEGLKALRAAMGDNLQHKLQLQAAQPSIMQVSTLHSI